MIPPTVFVIDDDPNIRGALSQLLGSLRIPVQEFESGERFLTEIGLDQPGCAILDLRFPGMSGLRVLERLAAREISPAVIVTSGYCNVPTTVQAMRAGAIRVLEKPYQEQELLDAIHEALQRDARNRLAYAQSVAVQTRLAALSEREREVLDRVVVGKANKVIARELGISEKNVEFHRSNVMEKLQAESLAHLVRLVLTVTHFGSGVAPID